MDLMFALLTRRLRRHPCSRSLRAYSYHQVALGTELHQHHNLQLHHHDKKVAAPSTVEVGTYPAQDLTSTGGSRCLSQVERVLPSPVAVSTSASRAAMIGWE